MHPADRVFMKRLLLMIQDDANTRVVQLASGSATDYADYRMRCGYVQALDTVRSWCHEIAKDADGDSDQRERG